jgi:hypothetical protein
MQRSYTIRAGRGKSCLWHSVNDAAVLVLHYRTPAGRPDLAETISSISAHPGEYHSNRGSTEARGDRRKQWIGCGSNSPHGRGFVETDRRVAGRSNDSHVAPARREVNVVGE